MMSRGPPGLLAWTPKLRAASVGKLKPRRGAGGPPSNWLPSGLSTSARALAVGRKDSIGSFCSFSPARSRFYPMSVSDSPHPRQAAPPPGVWTLQRRWRQCACALARSFPGGGASGGSGNSGSTLRARAAAAVLGGAGLGASAASAGAVRVSVGLRGARARREAVRTEPTSAATALLTWGDVAPGSPA